MDMDMYEYFREALKQAEKAFLLLSQSFEKITNELLKNMGETLEEFTDCIWKRNPKTPKEYGISLLKRRRRLLLKRYSYIPIHQKHLPYQRRAY